MRIDVHVLRSNLYLLNECCVGSSRQAVIRRTHTQARLTGRYLWGTRKRDFAEVQKLGEKPLDKANQICDNTAIVRKQTKNLRSTIQKYRRVGTLTIEEWK